MSEFYNRAQVSAEAAEELIRQGFDSEFPLWHLPITSPEDVTISVGEMIMGNVRSECLEFRRKRYPGIYLRFVPRLPIDFCLDSTQFEDLWSTYPEKVIEMPCLIKGERCSRPAKRGICHAYDYFRNFETEPEIISHPLADRCLELVDLITGRNYGAGIGS